MFVVLASPRRWEGANALILILHKPNEECECSQGSLIDNNMCGGAPFIWLDHMFLDICYNVVCCEAGNST